MRTEKRINRFHNHHIIVWLLHMRQMAKKPHNFRQQGSTESPRGPSMVGLKRYGRAAGTDSPEDYGSSRTCRLPRFYFFTCDELKKFAVSRALTSGQCDAQL